MKFGASPEVSCTDAARIFPADFFIMGNERGTSLQNTQSTC